MKCDDCPSVEFKLERDLKYPDTTINATCLKCGREHLISQLDEKLIFIPYLIAYV